MITDTLRAAEIMEAAGFTEKQAKAIIEAFSPAADEPVTKPYLKHELENLEQRLTTRIYAAPAAGVLILIAVLSIFKAISL